MLGALLHDFGPVCWANGHFGAIFKETFVLDLASNFPRYMAKMSTKFDRSKHLINNTFKRNWIVVNICHYSEVVLIQN